MARLQTAVLANAASIEASGLVSVLGAFVDTVTVREVPAQHLAFFVARLLFDDADVGHPQTFQVTVEPAEQMEGITGPLVQIQGQLVPAVPPDGIDPRLSGGGPLVFPLGIHFPQVGLYHVAFILNGDLLWDSPLLVRLAPLQ